MAALGRFRAGRLGRILHRGGTFDEFGITEFECPWFSATSNAVACPRYQIFPVAPTCVFLRCSVPG